MGVALVEPDSVITRFGVQNVSGVEDVIVSAIKVAQEHISSILETSFNKSVDSIDIFFLDSDLYPLGKSFLPVLRLKQGFVTLKEFKYGSTVGTIFDTVPTTDYAIDLEKGLIRILNFGLVDKYFSVRYDAGFDKSKDAPDWLKEAILLAVPRVLNVKVSMNAPADEENQRFTKGRGGDTFADSILDSHLRGRAFQYRSLY